MKPLFIAAVAATYALTGVGISVALERHRVVTQPRQTVSTPIRIEQVQERVYQVKTPDPDVTKEDSSFDSGLTTSGRPKPRPKTLKSYEEALACLKANIFHEARGESIEGQRLVGFVTLNRVADPRWPNTICDVVHQRAQFSWTFDHPYIDLGKSSERDAYVTATAVAKDVLSGEATDRSNGATHYYAPKKVNPVWASAYDTVSVVGNHKFLR